MLEDFKEVTNFILGEELQAFIFPIKIITISISLIFIFISLALIINEKNFVFEIKRRILDFLYVYKNPRKFKSLWKKIEKSFKKGDYRQMIVLSNDLITQVLNRFSYLGTRPCLIIKDYDIKEESFPNIENAKRVCELNYAIEKGEQVDLPLEEMQKIFNLTKDTLIKTNIIDK
jgi:hypothetical protein